MFKLRYITSLLLAATLVSCDKRDKLDTPAFDVTTDKLNYKKGDSVVFHFSGSPDIITFYSGEPGNEYQYRNRTELEGGTTNLSFSTRVLYGTQDNNLRVMASNNFSGSYDTNSIKAATWVDITNRFTLSTGSGTATVETPSGVSNITDLLSPGKPIYIAYYYVGYGPLTTAQQRTWRVMSFSLSNSYPDGSVVSLANLASAGWIGVNVKNPANVWTVTSTLVYFDPKSSLVESEDWVISKPFFVSRVEPDKGVAIKEYMSRKTDHVYTYTKAGTYKVTFVGANTNAKEVKPVVKELEITVTE
ncbi:MAG: DUF5017 domain-containing protein [Chitinophagaceae bacterium]|nr:DUF5017 domain-containing protein [Chitinophagaceae bacterium]